MGKKNKWDMSERGKENIRKATLKYFEKHPDERKRLFQKGENNIAKLPKIREKIKKRHWSRTKVINPPMLGRKRPDVTKRMRERNPMSNPESKKKYLLVVRSSVYKKKRSTALKKMWGNSEFKERVIKRTLKALFKRPTKLEQKYVFFFNKYSLPLAYCGNGSLIIDGKNPDFYENNGKKICIEVANKKQKMVRSRGKYKSWQEYEQQRIEHFAKYNWKCLVLWQDELKNEEVLLDKIKNFMR